MIIYLLKSAACLSLLLFFYHLVLEKEKMHQFNRFYLLGSVLFSFLVPLYIIYTEATPIYVDTTNNTTEFVPIIETIPMAIVEETSLNYSSVGIVIYVIISLLFLFRFGKNLFIILQKTKKNRTIKHNSAVLVLVKDKILPHTFWNYIFINKEDYETKSLEKELFTHELTHVHQKHTIDVIFLELLQIIFWVNPLFIFLKKAVQLNHEFLADDTVINKHNNTFQYQYLLLNKAAWKNEYYLASNLNYSLTKKRLKMMTTQSSQSKIFLKKLAVIPLLAGFIFFFAERVEAQKTIEINEEPIEEIIEEIPFKKGDLSKSKIYKEYFFQSGLFTLKDKNGNKISKSYAELNDEEKKRLIPPPPLKSKKKTPTQKLIESLSDNKKYAVWIDGKVIKNKILNNYKASDFSSHFVSFVHKNARSKKFPQKYQAHLETTNYFNSKNKKRVTKFLKYLKNKYNIEEIDVTEEKVNNNQIETIAEQVFTKKGKVIKTGFKTINGEIHYYVSVNNITIYYNKEGKKVDKKGKEISTKKANASDVIPDNYIKKVYYQGEIFYEFTDDKPRNTQEQLSTLKQMKALFNSSKNKDKPLYKYNKTNKNYEAKRNGNPHFVKSSDSRQKELNELFYKLGTMYFKLSKENKKKAKRPIHPHHPYLRLMKNNKVFYKLKENLTADDKLLIPPPPPPPNASEEEILKAKSALKLWKKRTGNDYPIPPPPPPSNHLDQVIEMAKKGAKFYYEGNLINSDKAIALLKKNKNLTIHSKSTNNSNYEVWISKDPIKK